MRQRYVWVLVLTLVCVPAGAEERHELFEHVGLRPDNVQELPDGLERVKEPFQVVQCHVRVAGPRERSVQSGQQLRERPVAGPLPDQLEVHCCLAKIENA